MTTQKVYHGNNVEILKQFPDNHFDSIVTDPPYGLAFMNKKWDYDVPSVDFWREALRVLKHGGFLLSFSGTRTYHRMVINIEDAGFEIRDCIQWIYGSGFPKSMNIGKAIDNHLGLVRTVIGISKGMGKQNPEWNGTAQGRTENSFKSEYEQTIPTSQEAKDWDGWGSALKPANEPICVARKPLDGTVAQNVLKWGTGGINIDACRIPFVSEADSKSAIWGSGTDLKGGRYGSLADRNGKTNIEPNKQGRYPANIILDEASAQFLDQQTGTLKSGDNCVRTKPSDGYHGNIQKAGDVQVAYGDSGGASRFFYVAKASTSEKTKGIDPDIHTSNHPTVKPITLMQYLVRLVTRKGGHVLDPFAGSGTTGIACKLEEINCTLIDQDEQYCKLSEARIKAWEIERPKPDEFENQLELF